MIIEKYTPTELVEVETLSETVRGAGGFGSTGVSTAVNSSKKRDSSAAAASHNPEQVAAVTEFSAVAHLGLPSDPLLKQGDKVRGGVPTTVQEFLSGNTSKLLMLYLSMHDCPGCQEFTPMLVDLY